ncbi:hypothetical protein [Massilia arenae]|uniref:DUF3566 domain-containing protein n=1 Tax=Massilia arenae TaxID=2603288 RepID=A0A5C7FZQ9_9BURK|nr:hypothetical protein [Massilia arenae]TXF96490.1 hypothetical protein FVD38_24125 [Massilia arenae]
MKIRIKHVGVVQCAKMIAGIYFVISLPIVALVLMVAMAAGKASIGVGGLILLPFVYAFFSYLGGLLCAWIYNLVANRVGGFEYTTAEITS